VRGALRALRHAGARVPASSFLSAAGWLVLASAFPCTG
jgi:hypothetical protein